MRILEIETFGRGGLIHYAYNLSCALAERGHEVILLTSARYELDDRRLPTNLRVLRALARWSTSLERGGKKTWTAPLAALVRKLEALVDALRLLLAARRLRPDLIHLHCTHPILLLYLLLLRLLGRPVVATAHVVTPHERVPLQRAIYRRIHRWSPLIIAHSDFDRNRILTEFGAEARRVEVIPHGEYGFFAEAATPTDAGTARRELGLDDGQPVALFFGYIREYKGLDLLLEAWETVRGQAPEARLVVAGDPVRLSAARRAELEGWAERLGAVHRFAYIPFSDVAGYFAAADLLVMPYRHISQSGVLYLALSLGVPVVATRVGALPEVLADGESGLLVPPEDPEALAEALGRALGDPELRQRLAQGGRRVAEAHSWPAIAARSEAAFETLAGSYRDRHRSRS